jgi:hypothetical protein
MAALFDDGMMKISREEYKRLLHDSMLLEIAREAKERDGYLSTGIESLIFSKPREPVKVEPKPIILPDFPDPQPKEENDA